jgi:hypothetical protein
MAKENRYKQLISHIFFTHYKKGMKEFLFERDEIIQAAAQLGIKLPDNIGDAIYSFRFRSALPDDIVKTAPSGKYWIIRLAGRGRYHFVMVAAGPIKPNEMLTETKIPDSTPGVIDLYALGDEQALLAKLHYNRLIDIFLGITCYRLQSHLRTTVPNMGQVETDEIYIGVDRKGVHFIIPVQAKGENDKLSIVQVEQDTALCLDKWPHLVCIPVAAQFMKDNIIALFSFAEGDKGIGISIEKHYRLTPRNEMTEDDWGEYQKRIQSEEQLEPKTTETDHS